MVHPVRWYDYLTINIYWSGLTAIAQTMTPLVVPLLVQKFVGEDLQGTHYGNLRLWSLMTALLVQAVMGMLSDRSSARQGRRRPFILAGTLFSILFIILIGTISGFSGFNGYWSLFSLLILLSAASNTSQAGLQGLFNDLVPPALRGRFAGVKSLFEIPLPMVLIALSVAPLVSRGRLMPALMITIGIVVITMMAAMGSKEERPIENVGRPDWLPILRLAGMTALFTGGILVSGLLVRTVIQAAAREPGSERLFMTALIAGTLGMALPVVCGVYGSIRIGLGGEVRAEKSFTWWVINRLAFITGATNLGSFAVYFLQARLGLVREQAAGPAGSLLMVVGVFILVTAIPGGWLVDRIGGKKIVAFSGLLAAGGAGVVLASTSMPGIYAGGALVGAACGLFYPSNWAAGTAIVPPEHAGRFLGISNLAGAGAGAIGAYIGGPLADLVTQANPQTPESGYILLFIIFALMFLFSAGAAQFLPGWPGPARKASLMR